MQVSKDYFKIPPKRAKKLRDEMEKVVDRWKTIPTFGLGEFLDDMFKLAKDKKEREYIAYVSGRLLQKEAKPN